MQASAQAVETPAVSAAGPAAISRHDDPSLSSASGSSASPSTSTSTSSPRRVPQRAIEWIGLALGIAFITAVALDHALTNDEFWSLAAGQWMLAHHSIMGLDPFSYTESHRRWVTDEWGSELALAGLFRAFGAQAYTIYAVALGSFSLLASMAYAKTLGARGGRVAAIVLLLAFGIAGTLVADRGLDFSLVWLPLELFVLAKARANPRWLFALPLLCVAWVNTHGSILLGLLVVGAELGLSLVPSKVVARLNGVGQSAHTGPLGLAFLGSLAASCLTPYGPGLLSYDVGVSTNSQIGKYISEWNSPNFHSPMALAVYLVPVLVLIGCVLARRIPVLEGTLAVFLVVDALRSERFVVYLMIVAVGLAAVLPARRTWGTTARRWAGAGMLVGAITVLAVPAVPAGTLAPDLPVGAFNYLSAHPGRIFTEYAWGDYAIARHRATFVDGRTDLFEGPVLTEFFDVMNMTTNPDPILSASHVSYVVWAPRSALSLYLQHDPRWHVVDRTPVALVFARR